MAVYQIQEDATQASDTHGAITSNHWHGWGYPHWASGFSKGHHTLGLELPLTIGPSEHEILGVYHDDILSLVVFVLDGNHSVFPSDLQWEDTLFTYDAVLVTAGNGWSIDYDAEYDVTYFYKTEASGYVGGNNYSPNITSPLAGDLPVTARLTNQTTDFDGSGSPITATGPIRLTITGPADGARLFIYSRSSTNTDYEGVNIPTDAPRPRIALVSGDSYYYVLEDVGPKTNISMDDVPE